MTDRLLRYLRIYYDRGSGAAILDEGPGSKSHRFRNVILNATVVTERAPVDRDVRPKFWFAVRNAVVYVAGETAYVAALPLSTAVREVYHRKGAAGASWGRETTGMPIAVNPPMEGASNRITVAEQSGDNLDAGESTEGAQGA